MAPPSFQRARQPHQKAHRRAQILLGARSMLAEEGLDFTLTELARRVGLAKSNVYRYFETREAILLEVLIEDTAAWVDGIVASLDAADAPGVASLAATLAANTASRPQMCELGTSVKGVLLRNVSDAVARAFQEQQGASVARLVDGMSDAVCELDAAQHAELIQLFFALVLGLWPQLGNSPEAFQTALERGARILARGILAVSLE